MTAEGLLKEERSAPLKALTPLIRRAQAGNLDAFDALVRRFQDMAVGYAYTLIGDFHLAEDAAQEAFLDAYRNLSQLREAVAFSSWFRTIVFKHCDRFRRQARAETVPLEAVVEMVSDGLRPDEALEAGEMREQVLAVIRALPETERQVITLFYISEYSQNEIAAFLGAPVTTVKNRLRAGRGRLKERMIDMAKKALHEQAPSRDEQFKERTMIKVKYAYLDTDEELGFGRGNDIWAMFCACDTNDLDTVRALIQRDPRLAQVGFTTSPIAIAVRKGHADLVKLLLENEASPCIRFPFGVTGLDMAKERSHQDVYRLLLKAIQGRFPFDPDQTSTQTVFQAVRKGDVEQLQKLLDAQPHLASAADAFGETPTHVAARGGDVYEMADVIDLLHDRGVNLHAANDRGERPVDLAIESGKFPLMTYLLEKAPLDDICVAAVQGDFGQVRSFLKADPELANFSNSAGYRPLSLAARRGFIGIVRLLLDHGADPNSALNDAVRANDLGIARLLLEHGARTDLQPVTHMADHYGHKQMKELLCEYGGYISFWDYCNRGPIEVVSAMLSANPGLAKGEVPILIGRRKGDSPLTGANDPAIIRLLLRFGAEPKIMSNWPPSYLYRTYEKAKILLEHGMDPNMQTITGERPLHHIAQGYTEDVRTAGLMLDHGADIEARDEIIESTPLGWAAASGRKEMVEFLLSRGASVNPDTPPWSTPLTWAEKRGHTEIADLLRRHGAKG